MPNKTIKTVSIGKPTVDTLLYIAKGFRNSFYILLKEYENMEDISGNIKTSDVQIKILGLVMGMNMLLPFACELGLTALYTLDHPDKKIPKKHSLLYWWKNLKVDTKNRIIREFEVVKSESKEITESIEKILTWNKSSHTEWRYSLWRNGFATGDPSSLAMRCITNIIIETALSYPQSKINRILNDKIDGNEECDKARKERKMI